MRPRFSFAWRVVLDGKRALELAVAFGMEIILGQFGAAGCWYRPGPPYGRDRAKAYFAPCESPKFLWET